MLKDPNISEFAKELGITPDWLKKKMTALNLTGYKDGRSVRLSPDDRVTLRLNIGNTRTQIPTPEPEQSYPNIRTSEPYSGIAIAPVVETLTIEPVPAMSFQPVEFQLDDRTSNIQTLQADIQSLQARSMGTFSAFESTLISNAAQRGLQVGLAAQRSYLGAIDQAMSASLGKPSGGSA